MSIREELRIISLNIGTTTTTEAMAKRSVSGSASTMSSSSMFASQHNSSSSDEHSQHDETTLASNHHEKSSANNTLARANDSFAPHARENFLKSIENVAMRGLFQNTNDENDENQENRHPKAAASARSPIKSAKHYVRNDPAVKQILDTMNQLNNQLSNLKEHLI